MNNVTLDDVDPGRHDWPTRARYCGLAVFMPYAIATSFDRVAANLKGLRPWAADDFHEVLGVLAYAWAVATQVAAANEQRDDLADAHRKKEIGNIAATLANQLPAV